ncbi:MAG: TolC family protein [Ginsengibacter sp.]
MRIGKFEVLKKVRFKMATIFFVFGSFLISNSLKAQESRPLSLQDAIELSLKNSNQLKASVARNEQAAAMVRSALDNRLPSASISGSYLRLAHPNVSLKLPKNGSDSTGGGGGNSVPSVNQAMYGIANVSLPVYAGGKIRYGIESAKYLEQAVKLSGDNDRQAIILNTMDAYVNLYKASETVRVVKENLAQSNKRDSVFSRLEQNGLLARNDLLKAQLQTSNIELSLMEAESNLKISTINMDLLIGYPEEDKLMIDSSAFDQSYDLNTIEDYEQLALKNRKDVQALSYRLKAAGSNILAAKGDLYPTLALTGGYIAAYVPHLLTITNAVNIGVGLQYNLSSLWKTKSKINLAKAKQEEIVAQQSSLDDGIRLQINKDYEHFLLAKRKITVYEKAVSQAEENARITKNKYDNGLVNTTDLLDANVLLLQSKINLAVSKADVLLGYNRLKQTAGILEK